MNNTHATKQQESKARTACNRELATLLTGYFDGLPLDRMFDCLRNHGFDPANFYGVYCGAEGRVHDQVGGNTWMVMTWHKMESGRYEVVAYVS